MISPTRLQRRWPHWRRGRRNGLMNRVSEDYRELSDGALKLAKVLVEKETISGQNFWHAWLAARGIL
jgi:hypothetical protein